MSHRYRMYPMPNQAAVMVEWCAQARFVWNLALEQRNFWRRGMPSLSGQPLRPRRWHSHASGRRKPHP